MKDDTTIIDPGHHRKVVLYIILALILVIVLGCYMYFVSQNGYFKQNTSVSTAEPTEAPIVLTEEQGALNAATLDEVVREENVSFTPARSETNAAALNHLEAGEQ